MQTPDLPSTAQCSGVLPDQESHFLDQPRPRILMFTWHSAKNLQLILPVARFLEAECGAEIYFLTSDTSGKMRLGLDGYVAFTVNETLLSYRDLPDPELDPKDDLGDLDLKVDWLWTPADPYPHPTGADRLSEEYKDWKVKQFLKAYSQLIADLKPQLVATWNGTLAVTKCLARAAQSHDLPCLFLERGLIPGTLVVDQQGVNYESAFAGPLAPPVDSVPESRRQLLEDAFKVLGDSGKSIVNVGEVADRSSIRRHFGIDESERVVLLPCQIDSDTNIVQHSPLVKSMLDLLACVSAAVQGCPIHVIVKPHPEDEKRRLAIESACDHPQMHCSWHYTLHSLLTAVDTVLVINSTVGLEALMQNIPVITLGNSVYSEKSFTSDVRDLSQIRDHLLQQQTPPYDSEHFWIFLNRLLSQGLFSYDETDPFGNREHLAAFAQASIASKHTDDPYPDTESAIIVYSRVVVAGLSAQSGRTVILGGFERDDMTLPSQVTHIGSLRDLVRWIRRPVRPDLLISLGHSNGWRNRMITAIMRPRRLIAAS
ncbi:hypothetical protein [Halochromatium roseum]|uniref:capsular polysaccharide export protein, LipB/KpsS family n=1 Tax=Halochromatium roseum TaxID=391920 RepID=UPI0019136518|nr:hypothetical protein [Halochromatium roseum]MBK5940365.1 hypothetical protein [Halochromatium roseum]